MLARSGDVIDSRTIAVSLNTNPVVVRRLLLGLRRSGLVRTLSGQHGGAKLGKKAGEISLLDIYNAVESRPVIAVNRRSVFRKCPVSCNMTRIMAEISKQADRAMHDHLRRTRLSQLLRKIR